jgi:hypothetical protein
MRTGAEGEFIVLSTDNETPAVALNAQCLRVFGYPVGTINPPGWHLYAATNDVSAKPVLLTRERVTGHDINTYKPLMTTENIGLVMPIRKKT